MKTLNIIYTPVRHENGQDLVQVCNESFDNFVGWADGQGKFDRIGSWEVCEKWTPEQNAEYARAVDRHQNNLGKQQVTTSTHDDGISRIVTVKY